jgi:hypothetical protein
MAWNDVRTPGQVLTATQWNDVITHMGTMTTAVTYDVVVYQDATKTYAVGKDGTVYSSGAIGTDDVQLQEAFDHCPADGVILIVPGTYLTLTAKVSGTKSVTIIGYGATVYYTITWGAIEIVGTVKTDSLLTASTVSLDAHVHVTSVADMVVGDLIKVWDTSAFSSTYANIKYGEMSKIRSIDTLVVTCQDSIEGTYTTGANAASTTVYTPCRVSVYGLRFKAPDRTGDYNGLHLWYCADGFIKDCTFDPVAQEGIQLRDCYGYSISNCNIHHADKSTYGYGIILLDACRNILISENQIKDCRHGVSLSYYLNTITGQSTNVVIENNIFTGSGISSSIDAHECHTWTIRGNTVDMDISVGIDSPDDTTAVATGARNTIVEGNTFKNCRSLLSTRSVVTLRNIIIKNNDVWTYPVTTGYGGIFYLASGAGQGTINTLVVDGNTVYNGTLVDVAHDTMNHISICNNRAYGTVDAASGDIGIHILGCPDLVVSNNLLYNQSSHGMGIYNCTGIVSNNLIFNAGRNGNAASRGIYIRSYAATSNLHVSDNYIEDATPTCGYSIAEDNEASNNNTYSNNRCVGYATNPYLIYGTTSKGLYAEGATATVADGGTITHGLSATPKWAIAICSTSAEFAAVTTLAATTFTVAIKKHDGSAGTTQTIYWRCGI